MLSQIVKGTSILVSAPLHFNSGSRCAGRVSSQTLTKSREFLCWLLFVVQSVEENERGAQSNDALLNQSFSAGHDASNSFSLTGALHLTSSCPRDSCLCPSPDVLSLPAAEFCFGAVWQRWRCSAPCIELKQSAPWCTLVVFLGTTHPAREASQAPV